MQIGKKYWVALDKENKIIQYGLFNENLLIANTKSGLQRLIKNNKHRGTKLSYIKFSKIKLIEIK